MPHDGRRAFAQTRRHGPDLAGRRGGGRSSGTVFGRIVDIARLPEWNAEITKVLERPATLEPGAQWVVEIRAMHTRWKSRTQLVEIDPALGHVAYRSMPDDGNPSYADWRWDVTEATAAPGRTRVRSGRGRSGAGTCCLAFAARDCSGRWSGRCERCRRP